MKIKRIDETKVIEFERFMEEKDWTLVITKKNTGFFVTLDGEVYREHPDLLPLGFERPTEEQAITELRKAMLKDGYFG